MRQSDDKGKGTFEQIGETMGGIAGRAAGQATDAAMGIAAGVAGTLFGTAASALGQWWSTPAAAEAGRSFGEEHDRRSREHFESTARGAGGGARSYESARPLYQFGHVARRNPGWQGRSFREVEPELERAWTEDQSTRYGSWTEVRSYVGYGYDPGSPDVGPLV
ncbi:MAG TPA: hypothetical protein VF263_13805 [Longimicrobiaceae bacterium]